jgi:hypothetical protein
MVSNRAVNYLALGVLTCCQLPPQPAIGPGSWPQPVSTPGDASNGLCAVLELLLQLEPCSWLAAAGSLAPAFAHPPPPTLWHPHLLHRHCQGAMQALQSLLSSQSQQDPPCQLVMLLHSWPTAGQPCTCSWVAAPLLQCHSPEHACSPMLPALLLLLLCMLAGGRGRCTGLPRGPCSGRCLWWAMTGECLPQASCGWVVRQHKHE